MEKTIILTDFRTNNDVECRISDNDVKVYMPDYSGFISEYVLMTKDDNDIKNKVLFKNQFRLDRLRRNLAEQFPDKVKKLAENEPFIGYDFSGLFV